MSLQQYLSEIFLLLTVDSDRKIALLTPAGVDAVHTQPIVARKPLRREETLLALRLRVLLDRHAGSGTDVGISRAGAREILAEHRRPGTVDDKRLDEQTDAALARLLNLKLILPTELAHEYRVSNALALALPFDSIEQIPAYLAALDAAAGSEPLDLDPVEPGPPEGNDDATQEIFSEHCNHPALRRGTQPRPIPSQPDPDHQLGHLSRPAQHVRGPCGHAAHRPSGCRQVHPL